MLRRLLRGLARRLVREAPRVPHAPSSGRRPPSQREEWAPPPGASTSGAPSDSQPAPATSLDASAPEPADEPEVEMPADQVAERVRAHPDGVLILDIRERHEVRHGTVAGALWVPMNDVPQRLDELPQDRLVAVVCAAGMRSFGVTHWLREQGYEQAWSVPEGIGGLASAGLPWDPSPLSGEG